MRSGTWTGGEGMGTTRERDKCSRRRSRQSLPRRVPFLSLPQMRLDVVGVAHHRETSKECRNIAALGEAVQEATARKLRVARAQ